MDIEQLNASRVPIVRIDNSLEKYRGLSIAPDKLRKANEMLKKVGLPKQPSTRNNKAA